MAVAFGPSWLCLNTTLCASCAILKITKLKLWLWNKEKEEEDVKNKMHSISHISPSQPNPSSQKIKGDNLLVSCTHIRIQQMDRVLVLLCGNRFDCLLELFDGIIESEPET
jgi:hypothetical protein